MEIGASTIVKFKNESPWPLERLTPGSIGFDLRACIDTERYVQPGQRWKFDTGIRIELPTNTGAFVQPRSGMGLHHGVVALTGVVDRDFRGRISVVLVNLGTDPYKILPGDRIAQLVIVRVPDVDLYAVDELVETARSESGFGSTGR